ncbi:pseudouridine synthase [Rhodonellum sp.]|uniref:pseudouridine synthase n=1 Tax=Rhodonellum sp. TaxID=2231180 RepID=UPI00351E4575
MNKDRGGRNTGNNSDSWSENRKPKRDGDFDRNSKPQSGRSDQGQKRYDSGDKKPFGPLSKDRGGKRDYNSDSRSENRSPKGDEGFDRNSKFDRGTKPDQNRSDFGGKSSTPESNPTEFTTVYKGRGRDEKPLFETVRKSELESKAAPKRRFNRQPDLEDSIPTPKYNMERLEKKTGPNKETDVFRLNKYISNSGICSRRDADSLIERGDIRVNGEVVTELGFKVERRDFITYNGKSINPEKPVYILLNKPKDFITTTDDPMDRRTVMQLISNACEERVFPVGRLDRNTTGLLLFTNDGELAAKLSHPSNEIKKIYQVTLDKPITANDEEAILAGITLEDGDVKVDDMQVLSKDRTILGLEIHVGKNRIVRRIFAHFGYEVVGLDRVTYAGLTKRDLTRGKYRFLTEKEVINLKFFK